MDFAKLLHDYRAFPRLTLLSFLGSMAYTIHWFCSLPDPTVNQVAFMTTMSTLGGVIFGFYTKTVSGTEK